MMLFQDTEWLWSGIDGKSYVDCLHFVSVPHLIVSTSVLFYLIYFFRFLVPDVLASKHSLQ